MEHTFIDLNAHKIVQKEHILKLIVIYVLIVYLLALHVILLFIATHVKLVIYQE